MGHFITVEGGEGVGKSTFSEAFAARLRERGHQLTCTREPGGTPAAQQIRELFLHPPSHDPLVPEAELFLIAAARAQHVARLIRPALQADQWVLCDRFYDSTRVYQGQLMGLSNELVEMSIAYAVGETHPELTFVLDCDTALAQKRLQTRANQNQELEANRYDAAKTEFHEKLRHAFRDLQRCFPQRVVLLDTARPLEQILNAALKEIDRRFLGS
ncbi:MAG: dTMP kinase [Oligoflexus sp.]